MPSNLAFRIGRSDRHQMNLTGSKFGRVLVLATSDGLYSWPLALWVTGISGVVTWAGLPELVPTSSWVTSVVIAGCTVPMFVFIFVCWRAFLRRLQGTSRIAATVVVFVIGATIRSLLISAYILSYPQELASLGNAPVRLLSDVVLITFVLLGGTYLVSMIRRQRAKMESVLVQRTVVDEVVRRASNAIRLQQPLTVQQVQEQLDLELGDFLDLPPDALVERTSKLAAEIVRPLSHRLAHEVPRIEVPDVDTRRFTVSWNLFWREVHFEHYLRPLWFCVPVIFCILLSQNFIFGDFPQFGYLVAVPVFVLGLFASWLIFAKIASLGPFWRSLIVVLTVAIASIPAGIVVAYFAGQDQNQRGIFFVFVVEATVLTSKALVAIGVTDTLNRMDAELDDLSHKLEWTQARGQGVLWVENGQLAQVLHGPVQSELHVALHQLRQPRNEESRTSDNLSAEVADRLVTSIPRLLEVEPESVLLLKTIQDSQNLWQDQTNIGFSVSEEAHIRLNQDMVTNSIAVEVCREAISNAVRHGRATQIDIAVTVDACELLTLVVVDNGSSEWTDGPAGLGTKRLAECAVDWSLEQFPAGTRLSATLPIG